MMLISSYRFWPTSPAHSLPGLAVERHPPDVAQAVGPDLRPRVLRADERVVLRDGVVLAVVLVVDVDAEDLAEQRVRGSGRSRAGRCRPAVADGDVQVAVRAEAIVPPSWFQNGLLDTAAGLSSDAGSASVGVVLAHPEPRHDVASASRFFGRVEDEELAGLLVLRVERQAEEALLVRRCRCTARGPGCRGRPWSSVAFWSFGKTWIDAVLRGDEDAVAAVAGVRQHDRPQRVRACRSSSRLSSRSTSGPGTRPRSSAAAGVSSTSAPGTWAGIGGERAGLHVGDEDATCRSAVEADVGGRLEALGQQHRLLARPRDDADLAALPAR